MKTYDYVNTQREDVDEIPTKWIPLIRAVLKFYTRFNALVYKLSGGRLFRTWPGGYPVCVYATIGKRSGRRREIVLLQIPLDEKRIMVSSQGGMETNPAWYYNLKANPEVEIFEGREWKTYVARQVDSDEKRELWPILIGVYPDFDEYQARTDRDIPVFVCEPK